MARFALALLFLGCTTSTVPDAGEAAGPDAPSLDAPSLDAASLDAGPDAPDAAADAATPEIAYVEDVAPMFAARGCATFACHGSTFGGAGLLLFMPTDAIAYADMIDRVSIRDPRVIVAPFRPDDSILVEHAETVLLDAAVIDATDAALVRRWVEAGAAFSRTVGGADAGVPDGGVIAPSTCDLSASRGWSPLPSACLPRCTAATWAAIVACRSEADPTACQTAVIDADPTAAIEAAGAADVLSIDCATCLAWQTRSCIHAACPLPLLAVDRCAAVRPGDPCTAEDSALSGCMGLHPEIRTCQRASDPLCAPP